MTIDATQFIQMEGSSPKDGVSNSVASDTLFRTQLPNPISTAKAGDIAISTPYLSMADGSYISSLSIGDSSGGNISVNTDKTEIIGGTFNSYFNFLQSAISGVGYQRGNSGTVTINTGTLTLEDGGMVTTSNLGSGDAAKVTINASESVEVNGLTSIGENVLFISNISSTIGSPNISIQQTAGYEALGNSGNVTVRTPILKVSDRAGVSVGNFGNVGTAGTLTIDADSIQLNQGGINASTESGEGGNITLNLEQLLLLRNQSQISAEAGGKGNGGNITINSPIIAGFENSDIIANAVEGNGGNIDITTQGIFGLKFRDSLTSESDITASSEFGVNGTVAINNISIDPSSGLVELPVALADSSQKIASGCSNQGGNSFVVTGRGGIPRNPSQHLSSNRTWLDFRHLSVSGKGKNYNAQVTTISNKPAIVEATVFMRNSNGEIELVALENTPLRIKQVAECSRANT